MTQTTFPFDDDDDEKEKKFPDPNARNSDPETSHEAAHDAKFHASHHRRLALFWLHKRGSLTDFELAELTGLQQTSIGKRRGECMKATPKLVEVLRDAHGQKVKRPAPSGSNACVWTLTAEGANYARKLSE